MMRYQSNLVSKRLFNIVSTIAVGFLGAALTGCKPAVGTEQGTAPKVNGDQIIFATNAPQLASIATVTAQLIPPASLSLFGRLIWNGDTTASIFSPVAGRVLKIPARLNTAVAAGEVLAEVDSPDYSQALADVRTAEGNFAAADKALTRAQDLLGHGAVAAKDVEAAQAACQAARAERDRAKARLANYGGQAGDTNNTYLLRSPLGGMVVDKSLSPGQEIRADMMLANAPQFFSPLFVITDPTRLWIQLDITENDLRHLAVGTPLTLRAQAFPGETFTGVVTSVSAALDPTTRTVTVRGTVDNLQGKLKAEMLVTVEVANGGASKLQLPAPSVFLHGSQHYVFVAEQPGVFRRREVKLGETADDHVEIADGVQPGERVVSDGALLLEELSE
jgi:cobalt-zinc-cadmium efflux system membrane fusion protein